MSHLPAISRRPLCALGQCSPKRSEIAANVKSMTPSSFIVAQSTLLTRSHCDHLRSLCDSSTFSVRFQHALALALRLYKVFCDLIHNQNKLPPHLPMTMMALPLRVLRYKIAMQRRDKVSDSDLVTG